jgi:transcription initiation factor IIF auxiliary subunit
VSARVRLNNYARELPRKRFGATFFQWRLFIDEPPDVLATIEQVEYRLHPTFPDPL